MLTIPERLPPIATELLVGGVDSPALRTLAGLDLSPFDPRDATELMEQVMSDLPQPPVLRRMELASALLTVQCVSGEITPELLLNHFVRLGESTFPKLFAERKDFPELDDFWWIYGYWDETPIHRAEEKVIAKAAEMLDRLGLSFWEPPSIITVCLGLPDWPTEPLWY